MTIARTGLGIAAGWCLAALCACHTPASSARHKAALAAEYGRRELQPFPSPPSANADELPIVLVLHNLAPACVSPTITIDQQDLNLVIECDGRRLWGFDPERFAMMIRGLPRTRPLTIPSGGTKTVSRPLGDWWKLAGQMSTMEILDTSVSGTEPGEYLRIRYGVPSLDFYENPLSYPGEYRLYFECYLQTGPVAEKALTEWIHNYTDFQPGTPWPSPPPGMVVLRSNTITYSRP